MKTLQFLAGGRARFHHAHAAVEAALGEFADESGMAIRAKGMAIAETVARQAFAGHYQNG